jgi:hypothetical protein
MEKELDDFAFSYLGVNNFDDVRKFSIMMKSFIENSLFIKVKKKEDQIEALKYAIQCNEVYQDYQNRELVKLLEAEIEDLKK